MVPFKEYDSLSMDLRVQRCTQFMRAPPLGPLMLIPVILIKKKSPTIYTFPRDMNDLSVPNIGHRKTTSYNADATNMDVTLCVTHHDHATLIWGGGR